MAWLIGSYAVFLECESKTWQKACPESSTLLLSTSTGPHGDEGEGHKNRNKTKTKHIYAFNIYLLNNTVLVETTINIAWFCSHGVYKLVFRQALDNDHWEWSLLWQKSKAHCKIFSWKRVACTKSGDKKKKKKMFN